MSGLERIHEILRLDAEAREQAAPVVERAATAEGLELTLAEFFSGASDEERLRGAGVIFRLSRALASGMTPETPAPAEAPVEVLVEGLVAEAAGAVAALDEVARAADRMKDAIAAANSPAEEGEDGGQA